MSEVRSLTRKKSRERHGETLVEGLRAVEAALAAGAEIRDVLVTESVRRDARFAGLLDVLGNVVNVVPDADLEEISAVATTQGVLAVVAIERLSEEALRSSTRLLVLDRLQDPGNAGTLIRSAAWFGVDTVVTSLGTVDLYNPKVVRSAMGGLWDVKHVEVADLGGTLRELRGRGFAVYGADMEGTPVSRWKPTVPSALVLGSEAHGLSDGVREKIGERVLIPGSPRRGGTESLNVAIAAGILMYEWTRPLNEI